MLSSPDKLLAALVTIAACLLCTAMAIGVSRVRRKAGIAPPAMTGSPDLERALRVHGNTVENLTIFIAMLWLAVLYFQGWLPGIIGAIWVAGRLIYWIGYSAAAEKRLIGFLIAQLAQIVLLVLATAGVINAWMVVG